MSNISLSGDKITSLFHNGIVNVDDIQDVIENQITTTHENHWKAYNISLSHCYNSLNILSDLVKLQIFFKESTDFTSLNNYIDERFVRNLESSDNIINNISSITTLTELRDDVTYSQWKYKDNSLKCIQKCNKLLIGLDTLTINLNDIREFIDNNMDELLRDSMTLLAELWLYLITQFKWFKMQVISTFIRSKCLLVNFELHLVLDYLMNSNFYDRNQSFKREVSNKLQNTILSFNSYISDLIKNMNHSIEIKNENLFNESFTSFLDIETMYNNLNFEWLIPEGGNMNKSVEEKTATSHYLNSDPKDIKNLEHISQYVDNMIELIPDSETPLHSPRITTRDQLYQTNNHNNNSVPHSMTTSMSITRELPHLLNAFNNVKRLENDIEASSRIISRNEREEYNYARSISPSKTQTPHLKRRSQSMSSSVSASSTLYSSPDFVTSTTISAKTNDDNDNNFKNVYSSMTLPKETGNKKLAAAYRIPSDPAPQMFMSQPGLTLSPPIASQSQVLKNDLRKLMSMQEQLPITNNKAIPSKSSFGNLPLNVTPHVTGFHSVLLNNLYGIGSIRSQSNRNYNIGSTR